MRDETFWRKSEEEEKEALKVPSNYTSKACKPLWCRIEKKKKKTRKRQKRESWSVHQTLLHVHLCYRLLCGTTSINESNNNWLGYTHKVGENQYIASANVLSFKTQTWFWNPAALHTKWETSEILILILQILYIQFPNLKTADITRHENDAVCLEHLEINEATPTVRQPNKTLRKKTGLSKCDVNKG